MNILLTLFPVGFNFLPEINHHLNHLIQLLITFKIVVILVQKAHFSISK